MAALTALVIDDSKPFITAHCKLLAKLGYDVTYALNGADGLDLILERRFNVVLCDIQMPKLDGLEMIKTLRRLEVEQSMTTPQLVICVSAGHSGLGDTEAVALEAGMDAFVPKPLKLSVLTELLAQHVQDDSSEIVPLQQDPEAVLLSHHTHSVVQYVLEDPN